MSFVIVPFVGLVAAVLTFFSGFGLGTLLLPTFALFFPVPVAIAATAVVHLLNNLLKVGLVMRHASRPIVLRFGVPAVLVDLSRLALYGWGFATHHATGTLVGWPLLTVTTLAALAGTLVGNRLLEKVTMHAIQRLVAGMLVLVSILLAVGLV